MAQIVPYINFADQGKEAIEFYKSVFGGDAEVQLVKVEHDRNRFASCSKTAPKHYLR